MELLTLSVVNFCSILGMLITHNRTPENARRIIWFKGDQANASAALILQLLGYWWSCVLGETTVYQRKVVVSSKSDLALTLFDECPDCLIICTDAEAQFPPDHNSKVATVVWSDPEDLRYLRKQILADFALLQSNPSGNLCAEVQCFLRSTQWRQHSCAGYMPVVFPVRELLDRFYAQRNQSGRFTGPFAFSVLQMRAALKALGVTLTHFNSRAVLYKPTPRLEQCIGADTCDARIV